MKENIERGIALLDAKAPGWREKIDKTTLNMDSYWDCVLGQVYGDYQIGWVALGLYDLDEKIAHGFTVDFFGRAERMKELTKAWLEVL